MPFVRSVVGWIAWAVATVVCGTLALLVGWIPPRGRYMWPFAQIWSRTFLGITGVRVRGEGPELPTGTPFVFVGNHESLLDIPLVFAALPRPARFMAKKILFHIPFVGWNMWLAGFIPVDRANRKKAIAALESAIRRMKVGNPVLVFPEETRSPEGILLPFQKGAFVLAMKAGIPIVPIGIEGTRHRMRKGGLLVTPGEVVLRWGEPIPTAGLPNSERIPLIVRARAEVQALRGGGAMAAKDVATLPGREELAAATGGAAPPAEPAPTAGE